MPADAWRMLDGISRSMSSAVRTVTGMTMMPSEIAPAMAEKWPMPQHDQV